MLVHEHLLELQPTLRRLVQGDEDALQDTNLLLLERANDIREPYRYATCVAKRRWIASRMVARKRKSVPLPEIASSLPTPPEIVGQAEELEQVQDVVRNLSEKQRNAIKNPCRKNNSNRYKGVNNVKKRLRLD